MKSLSSLDVIRTHTFDTLQHQSFSLMSIALDDSATYTIKIQLQQSKSCIVSLGKSFCICLRKVMSNTYCVVFFVLFVTGLCLVYPMLPVSLDCSFLVAPSVFSNIYFRPVYCVPNVASFSRLFIPGSPFCFL